MTTATVNTPINRALLTHFIGRSQLQTLLSACRGEEGPWFRDRLRDLTTQLDTMPKTYDQEGKGDDALATLHYFAGGACSWWITEKDAGSSDDEVPGVQHQAFGFACLGNPQDAELGYISIQELLDAGAELDLYWTPRTVGEIKRKLGCR